MWNMHVFWLEQSLVDVPEANDWLSLDEIDFLDGLRFTPRRVHWRLGRWTAKCACASFFGFPCFPHTLAKIEIRPEASGAPELFFEREPAPIPISLSHRNGRAFCAVAPTASALGCDLESIEDRSDAFVADYFTNGEQTLVQRQPSADRALLLALLWSGKESALKALRAGLRLDTRSVIVNLPEVSFHRSGWSPFQVRHTAGQVFPGWWQVSGKMVRTLVASPPPPAPTALRVETNFPGAKLHDRGEVLEQQRFDREQVDA